MYTLHNFRPSKAPNDSSDDGEETNLNQKRDTTYKLFTNSLDHDHDDDAHAPFRKNPLPEAIKQKIIALNRQAHTPETIRLLLRLNDEIPQDSKPTRSQIESVIKTYKTNKYEKKTANNGSVN